MSTRALCVFGLLLVVASCDKKKDGGEKKAEAKAAPTAALEATPKEISIKRFGGDGPVKAKMQLPEKWEPFMGGTERWRPAGTHDFFGPSIELSVSCGGMCDAAKIPENIDKELASFLEMSARPNLNSGKPELDAIRGKVEKLGEGDLATGGKWMAVRITYPKDMKDAQRYKPRLTAVAYHHPAGKEFYLLARASAPVEQEKGLWPVMLASIKSATVAE